MSDQPQKPYYLTTPIYYVNARPHIGHAYTTIVADVLARRHRLLGEDVFFLTGTDEHGQKIERAAAAAGIAPQQYADQVSKTFSDLWSRMGITHNKFIRTTDPQHQRGVQELFTDLYDKGQIYLSSYTGQYSVGEEMFVEGPPGTIGPDGRPTETVTEENFFFRLSDYQLRLLNLIESNELEITPESSRNEVLKFLRGDVAAVVSGIDTGIDGPFNLEAAEMKALELGLLKYTGGDKGDLYVPGALRDLSISRSSFTWGIPVPEEIQAKEKTKEKHIIYVWLDALANYITALGYGSDDDTLWQKFWPAELHLVGKEITRFHCIYWPAFLMAANLPLPKQVTANGWLLFDNSKMSKSKGNVVRTETILDAFGDEVYAKQFPDSTKADRDLFAADVLRYFLLRTVRFGRDGGFKFDSMVTTYNADLANGYGNLVSRTLAMIANNFDGAVPQPPNEDWIGSSFINWKPPEPVDLDEEEREERRLLNDLADLPQDANEYVLSGLLPQAAVDIANTDRYISEKQPWKLAKEDNAEARSVLARILYDSADSIRLITAALYPILPYATAKVWQQLGLGDIEQAARNGDLKNLAWGGLQPGTKLGPLAPIFPRADKGLAQIMTDMETPDSKVDPSKPTTEPSPSSLPGSSVQTGQTRSFDPAAGPRTSSLAEPSGALTVGGSSAHTTRSGPTPSHTEAHASGIFAKPADSPTAPSEITIDDFAKIDLRVAQIVLCERIPKADKLLRLEVDLGPLGRRQILSGIAEFYTPEELTGRRIVVITNLAPRTMRGLESHGMLLAASDGDHGKPSLASCGDDVPLGSRLK